MKKNIYRLFLTCLIVELFMSQKAFAYLDPGTGSLIAQLVVATIAGVGCTLAVWKEKIISLFKKKSKED